MTAEEIISVLGLKPHPAEGGYFVETYRALEMFPEGALPGRYRGPRSFSTAIYYLLTRDSFSALHRLRTDEVFHFYMGDPVKMLLLRPDGSGEIVLLGHDLLNGMRPQVVVPEGVWQGARLSPGGNLALIGTTVSPGFEYEDYEHGPRDFLIKTYPLYQDLILSLTI